MLPLAEHLGAAIVVVVVVAATVAVNARERDRISTYTIIQEYQWEQPIDIDSSMYFPHFWISHPQATQLQVLSLLWNKNLSKIVMMKIRNILDQVIKECGPSNKEISSKCMGQLKNTNPTWKHQKKLFFRSNFEIMPLYRVFQGGSDGDIHIFGKMCFHTVKLKNGKKSVKWKKFFYDEFMTTECELISYLDYMGRFSTVLF